ncbi:MAG TPA: hypothetical protein DDW52_08360 [Planctomycetaceae bacterium]|nr:hypothetical protein [Planctomycetaceae bacterium]
MPGAFAALTFLPRHVRKLVLSPHWFAWLVCLSVVATGCSRTRYRLAADEESYCLIESRQSDPRWDLPGRKIEPSGTSRMYVGTERDCGPKPEDDPAAQRLMRYPNCIDNTKYYSKIATRGNSENPVWLDYLPREENGKIQLTQPLAMDLALIHSRDYQTEFERVYISALNLSGNRFEFDTQWFGGLGTGFVGTGSDFGDSRTLDVTVNRLGFTRSLAGGGQFATSILNGLTWDFGNGGIQQGSAALVSTFTQPLLRGAFRHVRLEQLTQAERNLLYSVRDFARFRRLFYVDVATDYLSLLTRIQAISNLQANVENLKRNYEQYQTLLELEQVAIIEVDQVFQQYQNGRLRLLSAEQALIAAMDNFKFSLGLPAWVPMEIDLALLEQFELVSPELETIQIEVQQLSADVSKNLGPSETNRVELLAYAKKLVELRDRLVRLVPQVQSELDTWNTTLDSTDVQSLGEEDQLDFSQQVTINEKVRSQFVELKQSLGTREKNERILRDLLEQFPENYVPPPEPTAKLDLSRILDREVLDEIRAEDVIPQPLTDVATQGMDRLRGELGDRLEEEVSALYALQTQIRLFLLDIEPQPIAEEAAITFAHQNRLDVLNSKAQVVDAFRRVEVAADALQSDLSVSGTAALGSEPGKNNPFRFDSSAARYQVGVQFDGPLNRLNERNAYRATQIAYQQTARNYVADKDRVANEVRAILRQLELSRLNFKIARQQLVAASRQVNSAQIQLRRPDSSNSNVTLFLLQAFEGLLSAKNDLIGNWVQYRIQKMRLFAALEMLYLDESGAWINEETGLEDLASFRAVDPEYFPLNWSQNGSSLPTEGGSGEIVDPGAPLPTGGAGELPQNEIELIPPADFGELPMVPDSAFDIPTTGERLGSPLNVEPAGKSSRLAGDKLGQRKRQVGIPVSMPLDGPATIAKPIEF